LPWALPLSGFLGALFILTPYVQFTGKVLMPMEMLLLFFAAIVIADAVPGIISKSSWYRTIGCLALFLAVMMLAKMTILTASTRDGIRSYGYAAKYLKEHPAKGLLYYVGYGVCQDRDIEKLKQLPRSTEGRLVLITYHSTVGYDKWESILSNPALIPLAAWPNSINSGYGLFAQYTPERKRQWSYYHNAVYSLKDVLDALHAAP